MASRIPFNHKKPATPRIRTPPSASPESSRGGIATPDGRPELHRRQRAGTDEGDRIARTFEAQRKAGARYGATRPRRS
jgi:hypothetical protein